MQERELLETRAVLDTPEGVQLKFQLAGPAARMAAYLADFAIRVMGGVAIALAAAIGFGSMGMGELSAAAILLTLFLVEWAWGTLFEWLWNGRTPGKRLFNLRVITTGGYPIGFYEAVLRNMLRAGDAPFVVLYGIGVSVMMSTRQLQRLGDLAAGTIVVVEERDRAGHKPVGVELFQPICRSECADRFHVPERTLDVVSQLFQRQGRLPAERREAIAAILAEPIAHRLGFCLDDLPAAERGTRFLGRVLRTFLPDRIVADERAVADDFSSRHVERPAVATGANR